MMKLYDIGVGLLATSVTIFVCAGGAAIVVLAWEANLVLGAVVAAVALPAMASAAIMTIEVWRL